MTNRIRIRKPFDRHAHLRRDQMLTTVLPYTLRWCAGAVAMGNLGQEFETSTIARAIAYREQILAQIPPGRDFKLAMTCYLTDRINAEEVVRGYEEGVWDAVKLMFAGPDGTTGAKNGVQDLLGRYPIFAAMEKAGIPLLGHWETVLPDIDLFDREIRSIECDLAPIVKAFPGLRIVVEHITDGRSADFVIAAGDNVFATVTPHHLLVNRNFMFDRGLMCPVNYCKPVPKREWHRQHICEIVTSGHPRFGDGTDSAPHDEAAKSRPCGCDAGIFLPKAVEMYATVFDQHHALERLEAFLSTNFLDLYRAEPSTETITLERTPCRVPEKIGNIPVFMGGRAFPWSLVEPRAA